MTQPKFDIIVFGASGYTGRLVAEYLHKTYKDTIPWAIAGRSPDKLSMVRDDIGLDPAIPLLSADSNDPKRLDDMVRRTRLVLTTVGPYQLYGDNLLAACARAGTDYVDLCGEPAWMHDTISTYNDIAARSGARIVHSCGFDSIPFDMGVYYTQQQAINSFGMPCRQIRARVHKMLGKFSGGTAASLLATMDRAAKQPEVLDWLKDPFSLVPGFSGPAQPFSHTPVYEADIKSWAAPFIMAPINTKNIHRSNALLDHLYGQDFIYDEMILTGDGNAGEDGAHMVIKNNASLGVNPPKPGEGPSRQEREDGFYDILFIGETTSEQRLITRVAGDMDPGYGSTSKMISEAALCLVHDIDRANIGGGIYTPAAAMGTALIKRLEHKAGLTFKTQ